MPAGAGFKIQDWPPAGGLRRQLHLGDRVASIQNACGENGVICLDWDGDFFFDFVISGDAKMTLDPATLKSLPAASGGMSLEIPHGIPIVGGRRFGLVAVYQSGLARRLLGSGPRLPQCAAVLFLDAVKEMLGITRRNIAASGLERRADTLQGFLSEPIQPRAETSPI